jgi:deoxyribodipyrimidine photo-lyase
MQVSVFWFRRDLRLEDNRALHHALSSGYPVLPVFIFDDTILNDLPPNDARVNFIHRTLKKLMSN